MGPVGAGRPRPTTGFLGRLLEEAGGPPGGGAAPGRPPLPRPRPLGVSVDRPPAGVSGRETAGEGRAAGWSTAFFFTLPRLA